MMVATVNSANRDAIDRVLQYAIVAAADEDDPRDRELGPVHLLKFVYLTDLAWARAHDGNTYTGAEWRFHHFGPWELGVYERVEPAIAAIEANRRVVSGGRSSDEFVRFGLTHQVDLIRERLEAALPIAITSAVRNAVHEFGSDTASLLRHVYLTPPMLRAAPEDRLDFTLVALRMAATDASPESATRLTARLRRQRKQVLETGRQLLRQRFASTPGQTVTAPAPRYDEVFSAGVKWLDSLAGAPLESVAGELTVAPGIWHSATRRDPDLP
jgi:hypothetical protein